MTATIRRRPPTSWAGNGNRRLVVIGNGMAGARAVEEILARGGADLYRHHDVR